jgi:hypothetical protein
MCATVLNGAEWHTWGVSRHGARGIAEMPSSICHTFGVFRQSYVGYIVGYLGTWCQLARRVLLTRVNGKSHVSVNVRDTQAMAESFKNTAAYEHSGSGHWLPGGGRVCMWKGTHVLQPAG